MRRVGWPSAAPPSAVSFVLALNKAHVLGLNTAHVLRLNKAHVLRLNPKICPVVTANTKEAAFGKVKDCCSKTRFSELGAGTGGGPGWGGADSKSQQK